MGVELATLMDGIPLVVSAAERDLRFPTPTKNQRVHNLGTGNIERYSDGQWVAAFEAGGDGGFGSWNVKLFGAQGDGVTDDADAIQAAFDYVFNNPADGRRTVFIPASGADATYGESLGYKISHPLWIRGRGTRLLGVGQGSGQHYFATSYLKPSYPFGPAIIVDNGRRIIPLTTSLVSGAGQAIRVINKWSDIGRVDEGTPPIYQQFEFREANTLDLHGLSALTVEFFYKAAADAPGDQTFMGSLGRFQAPPILGTDYACFLMAIVDSTIGANVNTSNGYVTCPGVLWSGNIRDQATHHVAMVYNGATLRTYIDGVLINSVAATGTLVQDDGEDVAFGSYPDYIATPSGTYDSIRISNSARYSAAFTPPTAKFVNDANTLLLLNFDNVIGPLARAQTKDGDFWCWWRGPESARLVGAIEDRFAVDNKGWSIEGITIQCQSDVVGSNAVGKGSGIFIGNSSNDGHMERVSIKNPRIGIINGTDSGNAYNSHFVEVKVFAYGGRFAFRNGRIAGIAQFDTCWFSGGRVCFHGGTKTALLLNNTYFENDFGTVYTMFFSNGDVNTPYATLVNCVTSAEWATTGGPFKAFIGLAYGGYAPLGLRVVGGSFEFNGGDANTRYFKVFPVSGICDLEVLFESCSFKHWNTEDITQIVSGESGVSYIRPVRFRDCRQTPYQVPWSLTPGLAASEEPVTIDGWAKANVGASYGAQMQRFAANIYESRFNPVHHGCVVGVTVASNETRTAGELTLDLLHNVGAHGDDGYYPTPLQAKLNASNPRYAVSVQSPEITRFKPGQELVLLLSTDAAFLPLSADITAALAVVYERPGIQLIGKLLGANFNSTADQLINVQQTLKDFSGNPYYAPITRHRAFLVLVKNMTGAPFNVAVGGIYTGAAKTGSQVITATSLWYYPTFLTATRFSRYAWPVVGTAPQLYLSLTTPQGAAATGDLYLFGWDLDGIP